MKAKTKKCAVCKKDVPLMAAKELARAIENIDLKWVAQQVRQMLRCVSQDDLPAPEVDEEFIRPMEKVAQAVAREFIDSGIEKDDRLSDLASGREKE
jgi:hypothetical protein